MFFMFLNTFLSASNILEIKQANNAYAVGKYVNYYVDDTNSLKLDDIREKAFIVQNNEIINFGFLRPTYWFKMSFRYNEAMQNNIWWLDIDYPLLDYVDMYILDENGEVISHKQSGDLNYKILKDIQQTKVLFSLPYQSLQIYTVYLKVKTSSSMLLPIRIISNKSLYSSTYISQILSGMFYGILLILIIYNALIYIFTKEKIYFLYILFVVSYGIWQLSFDGIGSLYIWDNNDWMREKASSVFIYVIGFTLLLFSQYLLNSKKNIPRYNKYLLNPLKYISAVGILVAIIIPYKYSIVFGALLSILLPSILLIAGILVLKTDYKFIRLFVLGWAIFLLGTIVFTLSKFNLVPSYIFMKYIQQMASSIEMVFVSLALSVRFRNLQEKYHTKLKNHNEDLEKAVNLSIKKEREKEQILIHQSKMARAGEMIEQIAHQWRQPLNNIGLLNQELYFKKKLSNLTDNEFDSIHNQIDTNIQHMSNTIDDFRNYYDNTKEKVTYFLSESVNNVFSIIEATIKYHNIKINLDIIDDRKVHNVKNELLQVILNIINNAKEALVSKKIKDKKINISIRAHESNAYIYIEDNAGGINNDIISKIFDSYFTTKIDTKSSGIGLYMSNVIVEKNMSGLLSVENINDGARFIIQLPLHK